jgi:hypothetical protein
MKLERVINIPKELQPGVLYFSEEFSTTAHLCPCGCGSRIIAPIGPVNWSLKVKKGKPTLYPSLGNWELPCRSHYWIREGKVLWSGEWTEDEIDAGRKAEESKRDTYYQNSRQKNKVKSFLQNIFKRFFG